MCCCGLALLLRAVCRRKLSGAFLACMKLRARVPCRALFMEMYDAKMAAAAAADASGGDEELASSG